MMRRFLKKKNVLIEIVVCFVIFLSTLFIVHHPYVKSLDTSILDNLRTKEVTHDAVVIGIDDETLRELGAWPLEREVYAKFLSSLTSYQPKMVLFDVLFLEEKEGDEKVGTELKKLSFPVVFGSKQVEGAILNSVYSKDGGRSAYANVSPDVDGKVREVVSPLTQGSTCMLPLSLAPEADKVGCNDISGRFLYPSKTPEFRFSDVVEGRVPKELLAGKILFVGATTLDLGDYFIGMSGEKIPGVFIHAAMYVSYSNGLVTQTAGTSLLFILSFLLIVCAFGTTLFIRRFSLQAVVVFSTLLVVVLASVVSFDVYLLELPIVGLVGIYLFVYIFISIFRYTHSKKENAFIKNMFSKYVNKEVLEELLLHHSHSIVSEKRELSILFSDLRGFTDFSETLTPEELTTLLNDYFARMVDEIFKEKGTIDKFIGDAVMAFWNAPTGLENHSLHALRAAVGMQEALSSFNKERGTSLKMGIGLHRGEAVVGNIGGNDKVSYTALGDSINTASRIEGVTKKYGARIIITDVLKRHIKDEVLSQYSVRKLDCVRLKGKKEATTLYEVLCLLPRRSIDLYEQAFFLYQKREFKEAKKLLEDTTLQNDTPSRILLSRIPILEHETSFDGVWVFDEK